MVEISKEIQECTELYHTLFRQCLCVLSSFFYPWKLVLTLYIVTESLNEFLVGKCIKLAKS